MRYRKEWSRIREQNNRRNIGVFGLHPHAGATYVSVLLAEYLSNVIGLQTAVVETGLKSDLISLQPQAEFSTDMEFKLHHITYYSSNHNDKSNDYRYESNDRNYKANNHDNITNHYNSKTNHLMFKNFDCYVYDLGCSYAKARERIHACDLTLLLFTMTPWYCDMETLMQRLSKDYGNKENLCLIGNQIPPRLKKKLYQQLHCEFLEFEPNLFQPSNEAVRLFHHILW